jgi:hypothetical protein
MHFFHLIHFCAGAFASVSIVDPSDVISPSLWAADNAIVPDYNVPFISVQPSPIIAAYTFDNSTSFSHQVFSTALNQTSVILVTGELNLSYSTIIKSGYASNLLESSFWGFNAAINVVSLNVTSTNLEQCSPIQANASKAQLDNINVTVHNGAANIYVYGTDSVVYVNNAWLYSSGPVSHGVYASGNGTAYVSNVQHFSGGMRSVIPL